MSIIQQDTEFTCLGNCRQGRDCECDMWADERESPWLLVVYAAVIVASVVGSIWLAV